VILQVLLFSFNPVFVFSQRNVPRSTNDLFSPTKKTASEKTVSCFESISSVVHNNSRDLQPLSAVTSTVTNDSFSDEVRMLSM
jgi:hypothetical protein